MGTDNLSPPRQRRTKERRAARVLLRRAARASCTSWAVALGTGLGGTTVDTSKTQSVRGTRSEAVSQLTKGRKEKPQPRRT